MKSLILDGPMGTLLIDRGVACPGPAWSAHALITHPHEVAQIHREYAAAGATVHTANTFRTKPGSGMAGWRSLTQRAVELARTNVPTDHRVAGSISPIADCYRPDLSPPDPKARHHQTAQALAEAGVDLLLVETFPHPGEAMGAAQAAVSTGLETWVSLTAGPDTDLLSPKEVGRAAEQLASAGVDAVLFNCSPAQACQPYVDVLAQVGIRFGAYANAGPKNAGFGWGAPEGPARYQRLAQGWLEAGATIIGGCCGTGPAHIRALATLAGPD